MRSNRRRVTRLGGWLLAAATVAAMHLSGRHAAALYGVLIVLVTGGGAVVHAVAALRARGAARRVWMLGSIGLICWAVAETRVVAVILATGAREPRPIWVHVLNLGALVLAVVAMFAVPSAPSTAVARLRMLSDGVAAASALVGMFCMFVVSPMIKLAGSSTKALLNLSYPVVAVAVLAMAFVLLASQRRRGVNTVVCISGGVVIITASLLLEIVRDVARLSWLNAWVLTGLIAAAVLLAIGPLVPLPDRGERAPAATAGNLLPYLPAVVFVLAMAAFTATGRRLDSPVVWAGLAVMGAVLGRQFLVLRLTAALSRDLERERARLAHDATHDALTGLANRTALGANLDAGAGDAALLMIDLDGFKAVNDTLGHPAGDELLKVVAVRLRAAASPFDPSVQVTRLGGDEFAVLLRASTFEATHALAERILRSIAEPVPLRARTVTVRASIGIAIGSDPTQDLMRDADIALYSAKEQGKGCYRLFDPALAAAVDERTRLEADLAEALRGHQFEVAYQPVFALDTGAMVGAEALVRWRHPLRGPQTPGEFLTVAEEIGLLPELDRWVLATACGQAARWRADHHPLFRIGVNVSAAYLATGTVAADIERTLAVTGLPGDAVTIEVTEAALIADLDQAAQVLAGLRRIGVRVALDDFGVGYSSLSYLRRLPVDVIKIDRSFVQDLDADGDATLVSTVLSLAGSLGLRCVAEGVETARHLVRLRELGCELAQGYHFAPALPPSTLERLLRAEPVPVAA